MRRRTKVWLSIGVAVFLVVAVGGALTAAIISTRFREMGESMLLKASQGEFQAIYNSRMSSAFKQQVTLAQFESYLRACNVTQFSGLETSEFVGDFGHAEWTGTMVMKDKSVAPVTICFAKEDGRWQITYLSIGSVELEVAPQ
jgi:hypothetical protein